MQHARHPRFDLERFSSMFDLGPLRANALERAQRHRAENGDPDDAEAVAKHAALLSPRGRSVTSPHDLAVVENLRREALGDSIPADRVPVDVFVFGEGECAAPHLTRFGGTPFRSRSRAWPLAEDGRRLGFVGQLSFVDSKDLVPELPGDVLLVFVDPEHTMDTARYHLEWTDVAETDLLADGDTPEVRYTRRPGRMAAKKGALPEERIWSVRPCFGVVHRSYDLPNPARAFEGYRLPRLLDAFEGTKIGGVAPRIQGDWEPMTSFIGSLGSIMPARDQPFPWIDRPEPIPLRERESEPRSWTYGDAGTLDFSLVDGVVQLHAECY